MELFSTNAVGLFAACAVSQCGEDPGTAVSAAMATEHCALRAARGTAVHVLREYALFAAYVGICAAVFYAVMRLSA
jgi:hypothetical protein